MHRRTLLAATGSLAIGAMAVAAADADESTTDDHDCETVEIATAKSGDEVIATEEVPEPWWEQVERTRDVQEELTAEFGDESWFEGSGRTTGGEEICGQNAFVVIVYTDDQEMARETLGAQRHDVPIRLREPLDLETVEEDLYDGDVPLSPHEENGDGDASQDEEEGANGSSATDDTDSSDDRDSGDDTDSVPGFTAVATLAGLAGAISLLAGRDGGRS